MPRKKKTIIEETLPENETTAAGDDLASVVCVLTKVYKVNAGGKSFCFQTTEPVDEVYIQAQYPTGGKFLVNEFNSLNQIISNTYIDIEPKPLVSSNGNGSGDDMRTRLLMDELSFSRSVMLKMIEGLTTSRASATEHTPLGELAQAMQVVNEMSGKSNPVDLIVKGMELGMKTNGGGPDWKAQLVETAKDVLPAFVASRNPIPQGAQPPMLPPTPQSMMKFGIDWLKPQILSGMTVDLAIGWVIQNARDPMYNQLIATAIKGDVNTFIAIDPELANEPYKTWFESAIQLLKDEYAAEQNNTSNDNDGRDRNSTDATNDAPVSVGKSKITKVG